MFSLIEILLLFLLSLTFNKCAQVINIKNPVLNNRPIIGVLAQEQSYYLESKYPGQYKSYIAASYVKAVESAGARVVPVWIGQSREYYQDILSKINGVVLPGGATFFNQTDGYSDAGEHIFKIVKEMNDIDIYFPLWGTCLGFQLIAYLDGGRVDFRTNCKALDVSLPLSLTQDYPNSRLFGNAPNDIIKILENENVTSNNHQFCITNQILKEYKLENNWRITSLSKDINNFEFISSFEHTKYPIYATQFHPEKNSFEWKKNKDINHSVNALKANRYFMDFFVAEARKNINAFPSVQKERENLIFNYQATFTENVGSAFEQCFMFP